MKIRMMMIMTDNESDEFYDSGTKMTKFISMTDKETENEEFF